MNMKYKEINVNYGAPDTLKWAFFITIIFLL